MNLDILTAWSNLFHGLSDTTEMFDKFYTKVSNVINSAMSSLLKTH